jgi:hypothetical protein
MLDTTSEGDQRGHLRSEPARVARLDSVDESVDSVGVPSTEQLARERAVRVHAVEAVVGGGHGRGEQLTIRSRQGRARHVLHEKLVGKTAQMDREAGKHTHRRHDARHVR